MAKQTPFYHIHQKAGAKLVDFAGFEMPVQYKGIKAEHKAVRESVGIFDVSHMGEFYIHGPEALDLIQKVTVNDASKLTDGKAQYTCMCYEDGGIVDDLIVYKLYDDAGYIAVVNASNIKKDFDWITQNNSFDAEVINQSDNTCLLAVQGPNSIDTLQKLTDLDLSDIGFYSFKMGSLAGIENIVFSATGYTGEKGFELYFDKNIADPEAIWGAIIEAGEEFGIEPCGLGARDTLRLEMGYALYGNDITKNTHPLEARLGWITKFDKGDFIGKATLQQKKEEGLNRRLIGFMVEGKRNIPRQGYELQNQDGEPIGEVTSGTMSITLGKGIGMGYVDKSYADEGTEIQLVIRNRTAPAVITRPPFINQ
ncbi:glycine cleavage system aminomethyltransferase GcvT [Gracilimonas mengyeensis]|uniref:Aminomethyltransferase n=1 Tax=Gracilimonas mengyeensis TaxID=1302730 RepID=A0A521DD84_9BACT|nr:glycine cleavage system aminomethyltransferase GcvT [Gracilimonas mengyeensis]SMO69697.1 aminomethyltransferase [Gracilimonas mengyeensis]